MHYANGLQFHERSMSPSLSSVLDACERAGRLNVRGADLRANLPETSPGALRKALYRQQRAGRLVRLSRGSDYWLIVPLQHATVGSQAPTVTVGRHRLVFHVRSRIEAMPTRWHESADGRFLVSTPELTALDLIQRERTSRSDPLPALV